MVIEENGTGVRNLKSIQEDIKTGNYKQVYLFWGEETYLKQQYKQKLLSALNPEGDTMNFSRYEGKGIQVREVIDLCETMPFFAEYRVILVENSGFFKNKCEELADYMKELPDYVRLLFVESEVDKRSRMYKAVKNCGRIGAGRAEDYPAGYGASSHKNGNRYGESSHGTGKADYLHHGKRCGDCQGY